MSLIYQFPIQLYLLVSPVSIGAEISDPDGHEFQALNKNGPEII